jgi:drug/metabolite transporter (DMT)-like permease
MPLAPHATPIKGIVLMAMCSLCFALMALLTRHLSLSVPPTESCWLRGVIGCIIIIPYMLRRKIPLLGTHRRDLFLRGVIGTGATITYFIAVSLVPLAEGAALYRSSSLYVPFIAYFCLGEKISFSRIALASVGFIGSLLILKPGSDLVSAGAWIALGGALLNAGAWTTVRSLTQKEHFLTIILYLSVGTSIVPLLIFGGTFVIPTLTECAIILLLSLVGLLGQVLMTMSYHYGDASIITPVSYAEILYMAIFGLILFGQWPDIWSLLGIVCIVACGVLAARNK